MASSLTRLRVSRRLLIKATRPQFDLPPQSNWPTTQPGRFIARFPHEDLTIAFPPPLGRKRPPPPHPQKGIGRADEVAGPRHDLPDIACDRDGDQVEAA